ncbi:MAG: glutathione S-transferase protein [Gammaproteobacteria bacterium]|jgi:glutathione S-transferase|nr:glutathione S-transferase protein [Gammaproteobacteria bacterium]
MSEELILYHFPKSSCSRKVVFALAEKGIIYKELRINLQNGEQKQPAFLKLNPHGKVPVIQYGKAIIYDSAVINEFIEDNFPQKPLLPANPILRAQVRLSTHYADNFFYLAISEILAEYRKSIDQRNEKLLQEKLELFKSQHLSQLEQQLKNSSKFLFGTLTLADIAYAPGLDTLMKISGLTLAPNSAVAKWFKNISSLESFKRTYN